MSLVGIALNLLLAALLAAALAMGWRLNRKLKALRDSHDSFAVAVRELNIAAARADKGLADLRAATDEAIDLLSDRIEKGRALAAKLEKLTVEAPAIAARRAPTEDEDRAQERRLGALLAAAREARARPERLVRREPAVRTRPAFEDDLFDDPDPEAGPPLPLGPRAARR
jgi:hypothetical protein